jgi:hypothetical protein
VFVAASPKMTIVPPQKLTSLSPVTREKPIQSKKSAPDAEPIIREAGFGTSGGSRNATLQRPVPFSVRNSVEHDQPAFENNNGAVNERPGMSDKARGKQPAAPARPASRKEIAQDVIEEETRSSPPKDRPRSIHREKGVLPQARSLINLSSHGSRRGSAASSRSTIGVGSLESGQSQEAPPISSQSHSHRGYDQPKLQNNIRAPGLFTEATSSTSNVAVTGTILDQSGLGTASELGGIDHTRPEHHTIPIVPPQRSILDARFTPTPPTTSASVPLGRTKSQLTLLLEREKGRGGDRARSKS